MDNCLIFHSQQEQQLVATVKFAAYKQFPSPSLYTIDRFTLTWKKHNSATQILYTLLCPSISQHILAKTTEGIMLKLRK